MIPIIFASAGAGHHYAPSSFYSAFQLKFPGIQVSANDLQFLDLTRFGEIEARIFQLHAKDQEPPI